MAIFEIKGPDGSIYEVNAPDEETAVRAYQSFTKSEPAQEQPKERGILATIYDNVVGNPDDGVTSWGESLGRGINQIASNPAEFVRGGESEAGQLGESFGTWLNRAGESATLGVVGDEAAAAADALIGRGEYEERLKAYREQEAGMSTAGRLSADLLGGLLPAALGVGAVSTAGNLLGAAGRGAIAGGGMGAVQGFMEGEGGAAARFKNGRDGLLFGGAIGAAIPVAGRVVGGAVRGIREGVANHRMSAELAETLGVRPQTAKALSDTLGVDDADAIRDYLNRAGGHGMLADASPAAAGALETAMQAPGRATRTAHERITGRAAQAAEDLTDALDNTLGSAKGAVSLVDDIRHGTAPARQAAYDAAYAAPIDYSATAGREIEGLLQRVPASAIKRANELMAIEGNQSRQIMAQIADNGAVTFQRMPDVRQIDYLTRALKDVADAADGQGKLGGTTDLGRAVGNLARDIRGATKRAVPEYGKALDVASDAISERNAVDLGYRLLNRATTREEVADAMRGASQAELLAVRRGVRSGIDETLANVRATITDHSIEPRQAMEALRQLSSPASQEKMEAILGPAWPSLKAEIDKTARALNLRAQTATNSRTMGRTAANEMLNDAIEPGLLRQWKPVAAAREAFATATGASRRAVNMLRADAKGELADLLTRQGQGVNVLNAAELARANFAVSPLAGQRAGQLVNALGFAALPRTSESGSNSVRNLLQTR